MQLDRFNTLVRDLESGKVRVAEKKDGEWKVNSYVKEIILEGFRYGMLTDMTEGQFSFFDKDTIPTRKFSLGDGVRIVPGGSAVRTGAYLAPSVIVMPPAAHPGVDGTDLFHIPAQEPVLPGKRPALQQMPEKGHHVPRPQSRRILMRGHRVPGEAEILAAARRAAAMLRDA